MSDHTHNLRINEFLRHVFGPPIITTIIKRHEAQVLPVDPAFGIDIIYGSLGARDHLLPKACILPAERARYSQQDLGLCRARYHQAQSND